MEPVREPIPNLLTWNTHSQRAVMVVDELRGLQPCVKGYSCHLQLKLAQRLSPQAFARRLTVSGMASHPGYASRNLLRQCGRCWQLVRTGRARGWVAHFYLADHPTAAFAGLVLKPTYPSCQIVRLRQVGQGRQSAARGLTDTELAQPV